MHATLSPPVPISTIRSYDTAADVLDLIDRLGGIPPDRVRLRPPPGTATVRDVMVANDRDKARCELIDGTLVEKAMGFHESLIAGVILELLRAFVRSRRSGAVAGEQGPFRVFAEQIRMPDVSFTTWARLASFPEDGWAPDLAPDLAVEVLSESNTAAEIARKRRELFAAGTRLMWVVDRRPRTFAVYADADGPAVAVRGVGESVDGDDVLPGFALDVADVFAEAEPPPAGG